VALRIVELHEEHLEEAAGLVATRYRALREQVPSMPPRYEDAASFLPLLSDLAGQAPGVAALRAGRLAGFLVAWSLPEFRGKRAAYSPEWGNAADLEDSGRIYRAMYGPLVEQWVAGGYGRHVLTIMAHDRPALEAWHWQGFGLMSVDGMRDLSPAAMGDAAIELRRAGPEDAGLVWTLDRALHRYLAGPPTYLYDEEEESQQEWEAWLDKAGNALWLAYDGGQAVAYMMFGPASQKAATIIVDEGTCSITGAFTKAEVRRSGMGAALLNEGLAWAQPAGYERCGVDFEPENVLGSRFWMRHFQPVCYSLMRDVDERFLKSS